MSAEKTSPYKAFGDLLAHRRVEAGFAKQQELATAMGVQQQSVSRWEKGLGRPRAAEMPKLEKLVSARPNELLVAAGFAAAATAKATDGAGTATSFDRALPLSALAPEIFESFCAALLDRLYRTLRGDVHRYGGAGSKQHGIDIVASGPFGIHTFQCKRVNEFGAQKVHTAVGEQSFKSDLKVLLLSCVASPKARDAMAAHANWQLWDREDITRKLHELPLVDRLDLVDRYFSGQRVDLLGISEAGPFQSAEDFFKPFLVSGRFFNHSWALIGREAELAALTEHVKRTSVLVTCLLGAPGAGKSRLLREVVDKLAANDRSLIVRFVSSTEEVKAHHLDELRGSRGCTTLIVVDDAHERDDLDILLRYASDPRNETRLLLSLRPYGKEALRHQAANMSLLPPLVQFVEMGQQTVEAAKALATSVLEECGAPVGASAGIASATYTTPLVTVLAAQLVARDEIPLALLNNAKDLRDYVLSRLQDVITATLVTGQDAEKLRAILRVVALVQPIIQDDPALVDALSKLEGVETADASRLMRLLNEAGVLFKRGLRSRLAPDLLADEILRNNYIEPEGGINDRGVRFFGQANANLLKNMFVNLGRLDWRLREGKTDESKLLESLGPLLVWGDNYHNPHVEAVEAVAYYQPRFALNFAKKLIDDGHGESETVCKIARNAAFTYDHLEEACHLLWRAGRNDPRPLHQKPGHGIRLLKELAKFAVNKPVEYNSGVVNFALALLERRTSLESANTPFSILEGALETEMESTSYSRNTFTITKYQLPLEQARGIRQQITSALLGFVVAEPARRAFLAAVTLSYALRSPMHGDSTDGEWNREHVELLRRIRDLLNQATVHPVVLLGLANAVSWHAHFGPPETKPEALEIIRHLERDLRTRTVRVLIDGWGNETWELGSALKSGEHEEYQERLTNDLIAAYPDPSKLLAEMESCLEDITRIAGQGYGAPFIFMNRLFAKAPGLAKELLARDVGQSLSNGLKPYVGRALSVAIEAGDGALVQRYIAWSESSDEVLRQVAEAYIRYAPSRSYTPEEHVLFRRIFESKSPDVLFTASHLVRQISTKDASLALELACAMAFDVCASASHDVFMWLASSKDLPPAEIGVKRRELLRKLEALERLDDYWVVAFLKKSTEHDPAAVVELMKARLKASGDGRWAYIPFDRIRAGTGLDLKSTSMGNRLLLELMDWALAECAAPSMAWSFGKTVSGLWGSYDQSLLDQLLAWMAGGTEQHARLVAAILQNGQQTILYDYPSFVSDILEAAEQISEEATKSVGHAFASATQCGTRSTIPGEPFKEDLRLEEHCTAMLTTLSRAEPTYELYAALLKSARDGIARQHQMKASMEDEDQ
ncbi:helix-turn-helix protein [Trinickia symbiotica]|uniref:XRE family transcriptional regulator n=1 Tax=Trinickia symbiotica TaxID=863227 RepID=A0A2N7WPM8_9BURK|nr:helix-turn-helix domain-containing protein [Trinickia symbiotica]PMS31295.1 XRE family transcriptional regulator [Trinickia symbiotica]PPK41733.1 helix-turn-helix protein [Trinickia symbiotica]